MPTKASHINSLYMKITNANKPKYLIRTKKGLWEPTTDHSMGMTDTQRVIYTNAISNYSLVKRNYLLRYLILVEKSQ